ncbi:hypothetical protein [Jiangella sp. DSM 45060]|uniref:hypothetical protein n=1 Tax=Jiangella sp. DSM 45060 TaxID=1798224 RepID=UPI00087C5B76|nr:hypothetical protein [Jiangella sp. DSM 45060]SDT25838.1 hypothetical protein SAMN04515669_3286 [Jiangella sp. DSM 45060]
MTDDALKELFADALLDEPDRMVSPDEDIARGRAHRARRRRGRLTAGVVGVLAAGSLGLVGPSLLPDDGAPAAGGVAPEDQVWPYDGAARSSAQEPGRLSGGPQQAYAETGDARAATELSSAVRGAMPADVHVLHEEYDPTLQPVVQLQARRDGVVFHLSVRLQDARPDLPEFEPCTTPAEIPDGVARWDSCAQGYDDRGRWRVVGHAGPSLGVAIAEGGSASAMVSWLPAPVEAADGTQTEGSLAGTLTPDEANGIAEAAWEVGARSGAAELTSGFDLAATRRAWPDLELALQAATGLGPLTRVEFEDDDPSTIRARYVTADDIEVALTVWQDDRFYDNLCTGPGARTCESWVAGTPDDYRLEQQILDWSLADAGLGHVLITASEAGVIGRAGDTLRQIIPRRVSVTPASLSGD